jgi:hypothetical protein
VASFFILAVALEHGFSKRSGNSIRKRQTFETVSQFHAHSAKTTHDSLGRAKINQRRNPNSVCHKKDMEAPKPPHVGAPPAPLLQKRFEKQSHQKKLPTKSHPTATSHEMVKTGFLTGDQEQAFPSPTHRCPTTAAPVLSTRKKRQPTTYKTTLPDTTNKAVLEHVVSVNCCSKFQHICNINPAVCGAKGTSFRKLVQERRKCLRQHDSKEKLPS